MLSSSITYRNDDKHKDRRKTWGVESKSDDEI